MRKSRQNDINIDNLEFGYGENEAPMINNPLVSETDIFDAYNEHLEESNFEW